MWFAIAIGVGLLLLGWFVNQVNSRHEQKTLEVSQSPDGRVAAAWDESGAFEDVSIAREALDELVTEVPVDELEQKVSLLRLAIMSIRAERYELLDEVAACAGELAPDCCETLGLRGLALAYGADPGSSRTLLGRAKAGMAGCGGACSASIEARVLLQEVTLALDAHGGPPEGEALVVRGACASCAHEATAPADDEEARAEEGT